MELGWPLPKRRVLIQELLSTPTEKKVQQKFLKEMRQFSMYRVPIDMPKYRLANGRTQAAQEEYLSKHEELPQDFFERDLESIEALEIQHDLLKQMLKNPNADLREFFVDNIQEEPLILSHLGFVINGNRRLCAMREVREKHKDSNRELYDRFQYIDVIILPPCDEKDIDELEAQLQIKKDIKSNYTWVSEACMLRKKQEKYGYSYEDIATLYDLKEKEVEEKIDLLEHVDTFLRSRNKAKEYDDVEKKEFAFQQLKKNRAKIKDHMQKEIFTNVAYCIIDTPATAGRRYETIPEVNEFLPQIIERLERELHIEDTLNEDDLDLLGGYREDSRLENLAIQIANPEVQDTVYQVVIDVIQEEKEREKEKNNQDYVMNRVQKANTLLTEAVMGFDENSTTKGLKEQLDAIERSVRNLREMYESHAGN